MMARCGKLTSHTVSACFRDVAHAAPRVAALPLLTAPCDAAVDDRDREKRRYVILCNKHRVNQNVENSPIKSIP